MAKPYTSVLIGAVFASCMAVAPALADCGKGNPAFEDDFQALELHLGQSRAWNKGRQ